jgi:hypothetical protein
MFSTKPHELQSIGSTSDSSTDTSVSEDTIEATGFIPEIDIHSLPPTDHGRQAYLVLAGCTLIQAPVWGQHMFSQIASPY